ncbi:MAG TPA: CehA/McbA family metallohydrolase [Chloroflexota bacterium]|nr:CehA/McbA family metallohydrolase [Chloroflexota bacterium]
MHETAWGAFSQPGAWYKGNLHCHSTQSDGARAPEEVVAFYQEQGYDFLALSDHRRVTDTTQFATPGFLPLAAMEIDGHDALVNGPYHMLAIGLHDLREQPPDAGLTRLLDAIAADGGISVFCHPYWLGACATDLLALDRCLGLEVYNANCEVEVGKGDARQCWDDALQRGKPFYGFATDDAHWWQPDHGLGWIMVKAERLDEASLLDALRRGHFYSSTGPEIEHLELQGGVVRVRCTPVDAVLFIAQTGHGLRVYDAGGKRLTSATYTMSGKERYLRVECVCSDGTRAWSNPIWPGSEEMS